MSIIYSIWSLFIETIKTGGFIMYPIIGISILVWMLGIKKAFTLFKLEKSYKKFINSNKNTKWIPFDKFIRHCKANKSSSNQYQFLLNEMMLETIPTLESGFSSMSSLISAAPLLGLLGTVIGMIKTFAVIMQYGIGNPHMMAEGISIALLTTQAGLTAAFPAMLFHNWLIERKENLIANINRESLKIYSIKGLQNV